MTMTITKKAPNKNKNPLDKSLKKLPSGVNFTLDSQVKPEKLSIISLTKLQPKSASSKRLSMIISFKSEMAKDTDIISTKTKMVKSANFEALYDRKNKNKQPKSNPEIDQTVILYIKRALY